MNTDPLIARAPPYDALDTRTTDSAVSWSAIFAGAAAAAAVSILLVMLGTGLGLSSVSPWAMDGVSASTFGISAIVWVTVTQFIASGMGGYIAGRLRSKWDGVHSDEVHFRDTAHGFLAWAVASLATATLLASVVGSIVGGGVKAASTAVGGITSGASLATGAAANALSNNEGSQGADESPIGYMVSSMFRAPGNAATAPNPEGSTAMPAQAKPISDISGREVTEAGQVMLQSLRSGTLSPDDTRYLGQLVAEHGVMSQPEAEAKVSDTFAKLQASAAEAKQKAQEATDAARKASAKAALWLFISLLIGAFIASASALFGGRHRVA